MALYFDTGAKVQNRRLIFAAYAALWKNSRKNA